MCVKFVKFANSVGVNSARLRVPSGNVISDSSPSPQFTLSVWTSSTPGSTKDRLLSVMDCPSVMLVLLNPTFNADGRTLRISCRNRLLGVESLAPVSSSIVTTTRTTSEGVAAFEELLSSRYTCVACISYFPPPRDTIWPCKVGVGVTSEVVPSPQSIVAV